MIQRDGFYWIPLLSPEWRTRLKTLPDEKKQWPEDVAKEYFQLRREFTQAKAEFLSWIRKDRDSRMKGNPKAILGYIVDTLNFDTGRCDPSHQTIADEVGLSVRSVERMTAAIRDAGWIEVTRRGKTTSNFYRLRVPVEKIHHLLEYVDDLRDRRAEERVKRKQYNLGESDPTVLADHTESDPPTMRSHDPTELAAHDPTELAGKPWKGTSEVEPRKDSKGSEVREDTYPREDIPTDEALFGPWVRQNIPDAGNRREAFRLLSERLMTPEALRRLAA